MRSEYIQLQRSRTEAEIVQQAKQLLNQAGIDGNSLPRHDITRLERGVTTLFLADDGLQHKDRISEVTSNKYLAQQQKRNDDDVTRRRDMPRDLETTAERHIYMCQIPSQINRTSVAGAHVRNLRARLNTRLARGARQLDGRFVESQLDTPRRRPLVLTAGDRSMLQSRGGGHMMMYRSHESLYRSSDALYRGSIDKLDNLSALTDPLFISGSPAGITTTKERVL